MNTPECPIRFAVVDDDENDRWMIIRLLDKAGGFVCVGTYRSANEALAEIPKIRPDLVLMDIRMPGRSGIECMHLLKKAMPGLIVVLVSSLADPETMGAALAAGGDGYLTKPFGASQCLATLTFALRRRTPDSRASNEAYSSPGGGHESGRLTNREMEVMRCVAEGLFDKEIAAKLGISACTVRKHLHAIFLKLHAGSRTEAVRKWCQPTRPEIRSA